MLRGEIGARLREVESAAGAAIADASALDLDGEWDPAAYAAAMDAQFGDAYYAAATESEADVRRAVPGAAGYVAVRVGSAAATATGAAAPAAGAPSGVVEAKDTPGGWTRRGCLRPHCSGRRRARADGARLDLVPLLTDLVLSVGRPERALLLRPSGNAP